MRTSRSPIEAEAEILLFDSELGWTAALGRCGSLVKLRFGHDSPRAAVDAIDCATAKVVDAWAWCGDFAERVKHYVAGGHVDFCDIDIDLSHLTPFQRAVIVLCRQIPFGETTSYSRLALEAGSPGAARAVGNVMASNQCPLVVLCHRVVNADGSVGNYSGPQGVAMKVRLLALERAALREPLAASCT